MNIQEFLSIGASRKVLLCILKPTLNQVLNINNPLAEPGFRYRRALRRQDSLQRRYNHLHVFNLETTNKTSQIRVHGWNRRQPQDQRGRNRKRRGPIDSLVSAHSGRRRLYRPTSPKSIAPTTVEAEDPDDERERESRRIPCQGPRPELLAVHSISGGGLTAHICISASTMLPPSRQFGDQSAGSHISCRSARLGIIP